MVTSFGTRRRIGSNLYQVRTVYLFGCLPIYRRYILLTVPFGLALSSERTG